MRDSEEQTASGAGEWSAEILLAPGVNPITVFAEGNNGQRSRPVRKLLRYVDER